MLCLESIATGSKTKMSIKHIHGLLCHSNEKTHEKLQNTYVGVSSIVQWAPVKAMQVQK